MLIQVLNFQAARRSDPGRQEESPPSHARRQKSARYFPAADPITARGARFFPGRERKKSVLFATHCRYFPFFQPKKKSTQGRQCAATCRKSPHKKILRQKRHPKKGPVDFENRGEGAGRRHATTAQEPHTAILKPCRHKRTRQGAERNSGAGRRRKGAVISLCLFCPSADQARTQTEHFLLPAQDHYCKIQPAGWT